MNMFIESKNFEKVSFTLIGSQLSILAYPLKPIFHQKTGWRRVKFASPTNEMYMPNAKTQRQDPTPPIFHWLASGFGVGANANFRFGVGSLASETQIFTF